MKISKIARLHDFQIIRLYIVYHIILSIYSILAMVIKLLIYY